MAGIAIIPVFYDVYFYNIFISQEVSKYIRKIPLSQYVAVFSLFLVSIGVLTGTLRLDFSHSFADTTVTIQGKILDGTNGFTPAVSWSGSTITLSPQGVGSTCGPN